MQLLFESTHSLLVLLSAVEMCRTTQTALALARWPFSEIIGVHVCMLRCSASGPCILATATIQGGVYFLQSFRLCDYYLRAVTIQRNMDPCTIDNGIFPYCRNFLLCS